MKLEETELNRIDFEDDRFRISYYPHLERLKRSIAEAGLLNPIIIAARGRYCVIVSGWKRALACRDLSFSSIPCFILEEKRDLNAFQLAVLENSTTRDLDFLELAVMFKKLKVFGLEEQTLLETYLPFFGIPQTQTHLDTYLAAADFDAETKEFIHVKRVSLPVIQHLMELNTDERTSLLPYLRHLGQNKQKEFLEFLLDISKRDSLPVLEILASDAIADVIQSLILPSRQKADKIRLLLKKRRYPSYSAKDDAFESSLKKISWPEDISIDHSPFFEKEELSVRFTFKDRAEFIEKVERLQKIASTAQIAEFLKSISDG